MSQAGYTPIQLYYSTTAAATPSAGNLAAGELAVNITDGKLFYKDNGGVVRVLATAAGSAGDVVGPGSSTDNALVRFDGTTGKLVQSSVGVLSDAGALSGLTSVAATTFTGTLTGNASTATTLQTSRTIWGQSFDGSANVTGALTGVTDLTASGSLTLNGGTANGVAYLNGSKVLTSGSALTFDGTGLFSVVAASGVGVLQVYENSTGNNNRIQISQVGTVTTYNSTFSAGSGAHAWQLGGSEQARLTSSGFGVGQSNPTAKLQIKGGTTIASLTDWNNKSNSMFELANPAVRFGIGYDSSDQVLLQAFDSANGARSLNLQVYGGNVGIGTSSPDYQLDVSGTSTSITTLGVGISVENLSFTTNTRAGIVFRNGDNYGASVWSLRTGSSAGALVFGTNGGGGTAETNIAERARIDNSGAFMLGGTSALNSNARLSVWNSAGSAFGIATGYGTASGQFRLIYLTSANNALNFDNGSNNATLTSGGAWTNASDARIKTNIQDIKYGLETVLSAKPRSYNRIDVDGDHIGFVAQELLKVIPEVVFGGDETKYSVDYGSLVAVAFKAIQEQQAIITQLKADVAALKGN